MNAFEFLDDNGINGLIENKWIVKKIGTIDEEDNPVFKVDLYECTMPDGSLTFYIANTIDRRYNRGVYDIVSDPESFIDWYLETYNQEYVDYTDLAA